MIANTHTSTWTRDPNPAPAFSFGPMRRTIYLHALSWILLVLAMVLAGSVLPPANPSRWILLLGFGLAGIFMFGSLGCRLERLSRQPRVSDPNLRGHLSALEAVLDQLPGPVFIKNLEGTYLECNESFARTIFGRSKRDILERNCLELDNTLHPDAAKLHQQKDRELLRTGGSQIYEATVNTPRGPRHFMLHRTLKLDEHQQPLYIIGVMTELTLLRKAEQALDESRSVFQTICNAAHDGIIMIDEKGYITFWNQAAEKIFGFPTENAIHQPVIQLLAPEDRRERYLRLFERFKRHGHRPGRRHYPQLLAQTRDQGLIPIELSTSTLSRKGRWHGLALVRDLSDRLQAEHALRESEARFRAVAENIGMGLAVIDTSHRMQYLNPRMKQWFPEVDVASGSGCDHLLRHAESPKPCTDCPTTKTLSDGQVHESEIHLLKGGATRHLRIVASPIVNGAGQPTAVIEMVEDVTERKTIEQQLRNSERLLNFAIDQIPIPVLIAYPPGATIRRVNTAARKLMLQQPDADSVIPLGRHLEFWPCYDPQGRLYRPEDLPLTRAIIRGEYVQNEEVIIRQDHEDHWVSAHAAPLRDDHDEIIAGIVAFPEITHQKRAETAVRQNLSRLNTILDSISVGYLIVDAENHRIVEANRVAAQMTGTRLHKLIGANCRNHLCDGPVRPCSDHRKKVRLSECDEDVLVRRDGARVPIHRTVVPFALEGRYCLLESFIDLTERKQLEAKLRQAQKLESIGQLAAGIAHEINTPTQFIGDNIRFIQESFTEVLKVMTHQRDLIDHSTQPDDAIQALRQIRSDFNQTDMDFLIEEVPRAIQQSLEGVQRVTDIVGAMKQFSHPDSGQFIFTDLNKTIASTITVARNEWKYVAELNTDFATDLPQVPCLVGEFNQAFLNLLVNAAQAIAELRGANGTCGKGRIDVQTRHVIDHVEVRIRDTGAGIPEEIRERIFDPFFTTKEVGVGSGQGLALVHNIIVEKHHGTITFETTPGQGTTFIIQLPIKAGAEPEAAVQ